MFIMQEEQKQIYSIKIGRTSVKTTNLQMEIDLTMELNGTVTIFEGKNGFAENFAVYQIFHPFLYYQKLKRENKIAIKNITCCYLLRKKEKENSIIKIYNYTFQDKSNMTSIKLLKSKQYNLTQR